MQRAQPLECGAAAREVSEAPLQQVLARCGLQSRTTGWRAALPFAPGDVTAGAENEMATAVSAAREDSDFAAALDADPRIQPRAGALQDWIAQHDGLWHHGWLRLRWDDLPPQLRAALEADLSHRPDRSRFLVEDRHGPRVRLPASHVLRLALMDAAAGAAQHAVLCNATARVLRGIINDNTQPEILSAYLARDGAARSLGADLAEECALRHLLVQALAAWANDRFGLRDSGQQLLVYAAPTPPGRLQSFAQLVPAEVYRALMMNPSLAGFDDGVTKGAYMHLCHETLSRSRLAAMGRVRAAGIGMPRGVTRLPCDTSLLNCGTHVSLGSQRLGALAGDGSGGPWLEKRCGDLVSKMFEHFLPLFAGTFSAAPGRVPVSRLRPEQTLAFLPLELEAPQLRQTWAAWKRKAGLLGVLRGDVVADARLLDYFTALPSTRSQHGHDGVPGNDARLLAALEAEGIYDRRMSFYDLYKLRSLARVGFSGFEARFYSAFPRFAGDMAPAVDLQRLITFAAWSAMVRGTVDHADLPDDPESQGERRQMLFHAAIGVPFFYVRRRTRNVFLLRLLARTRDVRLSKRYPSCFKVGMAQYAQALCEWLRSETGDVAASGTADLLGDAVARVRGEGTAGARLLSRARALTEPGRINPNIEAGYRTRLRDAHTAEALAVAAQRFAALERDPQWCELVRCAGGGAVDPGTVLAEARACLADGRPASEALRRLIVLLVLHAEHRERGRAA